MSRRLIMLPWPFVSSLSGSPSVLSAASRLEHVGRPARRLAVAAEDDLPVPALPRERRRRLDHLARRRVDREVEIVSVEKVVAPVAEAEDAVVRAGARDVDVDVSLEGVRDGARDILLAVNEPRGS